MSAHEKLRQLCGPTAVVVLGYFWVPCLLAPLFLSTGHTRMFLFLFLLRHLRLLISIVGTFFFHSIAPERVLDPSTGEHRPAIRPQDATVVVPTVDPGSEDFGEMMVMLLKSGVRAIIISTVGEDKEVIAKGWLEHGKSGGGECATDVVVVRADRPNKRWQLAAAMPLVDTELVIFADDHVFWPEGYVEALLAPFQDPKMGGVCTQKRVRRERQGLGFLRAPTWAGLLGGMWAALSADLLNFLACIYIERYNFELRASVGTDGCVYVISGRTAAYRTSIVKDEAFLDYFCNEYWSYGFGKIGPLNSEDDNCITRYLFNNGWLIHFQSGTQATMETRLGVEGWTKFMRQNVRWARSGPRSNITMLCGPAVWAIHPISVYSVWMARIISFTLYHDAALVWLAHTSGVVSPWHVLAFTLATKMIKPLPHFLRHPADLVYLPHMIVFAWYHSLIKTWSVLTILETAWGSRPGVVA
ncbi:hypothetical protein RB595_006076 [Gaeumannomyces hyphopodioides]